MSTSEDNSHLVMLALSATMWNAWRAKNPEIVPSLQGACLVDFDLRNFNLAGARIEKANLTGRNLLGANLKGSHLYDSKLTGAQLSNVDLSGADLRNADLSHAKLVSANLSKAKLQGACFAHADLYSAKLNGTRLTEVNLANADLRRASGVLLDDSRIKESRFSPKAADPWSCLRRHYTGPMMALNFALLILFFAPYTVKALLWSTVNKSQTAFEAARNRTLDLAGRKKNESENLLKQLSTSGSPTAAYTTEQLRTTAEYLSSTMTSDLLRATAEQLQELQPCLSKTCDAPQSIALLLFDVRKGWERAMLAIALVLYNLLRAYLTREVALLRDAEDRSKVSPKLKTYSRKWLMHKWLMSWLSLVAGLAMMHRLWILLIETTVSLPKMG